MARRTLDDQNAIAKANKRASQLLHRAESQQARHQAREERAAKTRRYRLGRCSKASCLRSLGCSRRSKTSCTSLRRNSLFYRSERGAEVGDMLMSPIHTAQLRGENPFEYLAAVLQNENAVATHPADWLPWTYRATLECLVATSDATAAQTA
jgi:hypothetical protein